MPSPTMSMGLGSEAARRGTGSRLRLVELFEISPSSSSDNGTGEDVRVRDMSGRSDGEPSFGNAAGRLRGAVEGGESRLKTGSDSGGLPTDSDDGISCILSAAGDFVT